MTSSTTRASTASGGPIAAETCACAARSSVRGGAIASGAEIWNRNRVDLAFVCNAEHAHQPAGVGRVDVGQQERVGLAEDREVGAETKAERQHGDGRGQWLTAESTERVVEIADPAHDESLPKSEMGTGRTTRRAPPGAGSRARHERRHRQFASGRRRAPARGGRRQAWAPSRSAGRRLPDRRPARASPRARAIGTTAASAQPRLAFDANRAEASGFA